MAAVLELTERLEAELPEMLAEHRSIVDALNRLREDARRAGRDDVVAFAGVRDSLDARLAKRWPFK